ncbi:hypothetical protein CES85_5857 (plasmid) [Ochrobactrum quorumnocens]|uniref:Uncharacterized protein n=1 Tax=Ochrobactrum quorumnocens TaxID=271865 RepID=A0A248U928_9HYPH|nr:hypothetical protein CES85_5857 [[Ochrobactrum] quorumnocens]
MLNSVQSCSLRGAVMARGDLNDEEWYVTKCLLPQERGTEVVP